MKKSLLPFCVDLDGTLIKESVSEKALGVYIRGNFLRMVRAFFWAFRGRAYFKSRLAKFVELDAANLEYNKEFLEYVVKKKKEGHKIFLATGCNKTYANKIADYLGIFDGVFASDNRVNLIKEAKAETLTAIFGEKGFIYAGNSTQDIPVWEKCAESILVTPTKCALEKMRGQSYTLFE
jgi:phosphoserine phosphatase